MKKKEGPLGGKSRAGGSGGSSLIPPPPGGKVSLTPLPEKQVPSCTAQAPAGTQEAGLVECGGRAENWFGSCVQGLPTNPPPHRRRMDPPPWPPGSWVCLRRFLALDRTGASQFASQSLWVAANRSSPRQEWVSASARTVCGCAAPVSRPQRV